LELSLTKYKIFDILILSILYIIFIIISIKFSLIAPALLLGMILLFFILNYSHIGLFILILGYYFISKSTEAITVYEILFIFLFGFVFFIWLIREFTSVYSFKTFENRDYILFIFFGVALFSLIPAILNGNDLFKWFRELFPFTILMLYYPIRESIKSRKIIALYFAAFIILGLVISINNAVNYKTMMLEVTKDWQIMAYRQPFSESILLASFLLCFSSLIYNRNIFLRILFALLSIVFAVSLAFSFSRGYWLSAILGILILFIILEFRTKIKIIAIVLSLLLLFIGSFYILFEDMTINIIKSISERFATIENISEDISVMNRLEEYKALTSVIVKNPILGYGLGAEFYYYNIINVQDFKSWYTHNAYLYLIFKLGLLGFITFFWFYFSHIYTGIKAFLISNNRFHKSVLLGIISIMLTFLPLSLTSPQFFQKNSLLILALGTALISKIYNYERRK